MTCHHPEACILIFAREPREGRVKTRLEPLLGKEGALSLHKRLIEHTVNMVSGSGLGAWELWVDGNPRSAFFDRLLPASRRHAQYGKDLGARMRHAAGQALTRSRRVLLLGADCASVDAHYLADALHRLEQGDQVVLGPAEDGGYVLLGLTTTELPLFDRIPWGSADVLEITRQRLRAAGVCWSQLPPRWDVDRPEDVKRLASLAHWLE